ncbi:MAG: hypothetical protein ABIG66_01400 [Candidatus Kerfeldbacteria bacterium]
MPQATPQSKKQGGLMTALIIIAVVALVALGTYQWLGNDDLAGDTTEDTETVQQTDETTADSAPVNDENGDADIEGGAKDVPEPEFSFPGNEPTASSADGDSAVYEYGDDNAVSTMPSDSESVIRGSYGAYEEEEITIDGNPAARIMGTSPKDGSTVTYILMKRGDEVYFFRGTESFLDDVTNNITFNE